MFNLNKADKTVLTRATNLSCVPLSPIVETIALQTWTDLFCKLIVSQGSSAWFLPYIDFLGFNAQCWGFIELLHLSEGKILFFSEADKKNIAGFAFSQDKLWFCLAPEHHDSSSAGILFRRVTGHAAEKRWAGENVKKRIKRFIKNGIPTDWAPCEGQECWHFSWITFTFLGAAIQGKCPKTKGERFPVPQILSFFASGLVGLWCWALSTPRALEELLEQRGIPRISVRDTQGRSRGFTPCWFLARGSPGNIQTNPGTIPGWSSSGTLSSGALCWAVSLLHPARENRELLILKVFSNLQIPWS